MPKLIETKKYVIEDGREFELEEEAKKYEDLAKAKASLEMAARNFDQVLASHLQTADGYPFSLSGSYYILTDHIYEPRVVMESLSCWRCIISLEEHTPRIIKYKASGTEIVEFSLSQIYEREENAQRALIKIKKQHARWLAEDIAELEKKWAKR